MDDFIVQELEKLNFSKMEAQVYITLIKQGELNGSQIAKLLGASRSSVYAALNNLDKRGVVYSVPGETNIYRGERPEVLVEKLKNSFIKTTDILKEKMSQLNTDKKERNYINIKGTDNFIEKARELLLTAKREVYINTCIDLQVFREELVELGRRKVRIIAFSYDKLNIDGLPVELYSHPIDVDCKGSCDSDNIRLMLVMDMTTTLIGSAVSRGEDIIGTFTENPLLVSIVSEHIHHDIYLLKLKQKYGEKLIGKDITIDSLQEKKVLEVDSPK